MFAGSPARKTSRSTSYAPVAFAPAIVHESSGRSWSRCVTMRVSGNRGSRHRARDARTVAIVLDDLFGRGRCHEFVELVVDLHCGCTATRGETFDFLDGDVGVAAVA